MKSLNSGIVTILNYGKDVPSTVSHVTMAHEIGHNMGSQVRIIQIEFTANEVFLNIRVITFSHYRDIIIPLPLVKIKYTKFHETGIARYFFTFVCITVKLVGAGKVDIMHVNMQKIMFK